MTIIVSTAQIDLITMYVKVLRISFENETDVIVYLPEQSGFANSFPDNWDSLSVLSRASYISNYPNHQGNFLLNIIDFSFPIINSSNLNFTIPKYSFGTFLLLKQYATTARVIKHETPITRRLILPFEGAIFNFDPTNDIHNVDCINLQFYKPVTGDLDIVTKFNIPFF